MHLSDPAISNFSNDNIIQVERKEGKERKNERGGEGGREWHAINIFKDC